jgi:hypothetical protein
MIRYFIFLIFFSIGCRESRRDAHTGIIEIEPKQDSCYTLKENGQIMQVSRRFIILENTLTDTILLGFTIVSPKYTGEVIYLQQDTVTSRSLSYLNGDSEVLPKTNKLCLHLYQNKLANGKIRVQYFY